MDTYICIYINENCINKVHIYEKSINIDEVDIKIIVLSNKESYGNKSSYKYFIGYIYIYIYIYLCEGNAPLSPLCRKFRQMNVYAKDFRKNNKCMNFIVYDKKYLKKYYEIWNKTKNLFGKKFDSETIYNDKYIKTKINSYNTNFCGNKTFL